MGSRDVPDVGCGGAQVYCSEGAIRLQLSILGSADVKRILELSKKDTPLTEEEGKYVVRKLTSGIKRCVGNNGAKAALNAIKFIAGVGNVLSIRWAAIRRAARADGRLPRGTAATPLQLRASVDLTRAITGRCPYITAPRRTRCT